MDKIEQLLDVIEHPEKYTTDKLQHLATDPETAELYKTLCSTRASFFKDKRLDDEEVDDEWRKFKRQHNRNIFKNMIGRRNVAAIITLTVVTCSILAIGFSIGLTKVKGKIDAKPAESIQPELEVKSAPDIYPDTVISADNALIFEDETLYDILTRIIPHYGLKMELQSDTAKEVRLFFKWDSSLSINDVVEQLNTFDRINLSMNNDTLIID